MVFFSSIYTFSITFAYKKARELMFAQYPGLKSSCRSLWAGLPLPLAVTFGRRRAVHSFGSDRFVQPGRCTFAHNGSLHGAVRSRSASFCLPSFPSFHHFLIPTWLVVWCVCSIFPFTYIVNRLSPIFSKNWGSVFRGYYEQGKNLRQDQAGSRPPVKEQPLY